MAGKGTEHEEQSLSEVRRNGNTVADDARDEVYGLWQDGRISESDVAGDKDLKRIYRELAKQDLYFFCKGVLGYPDLIPEVHKPYAQFIQDYKTNRKTLDLMPRGVFKTTIGTIGFGAWYLLRHPNDFVMIANQTATNAERMLSEIGQHFEGGNQMINWLFPEYVRPGDRWKPWNQQQITFPARTVNRGTPSLTAMGVGAKAESNHFHVIINDDLIGQKALDSDLEMMSAISWHDYSVSLFVKIGEGIERVHGTRWGLSDLYSLLLEDPEYAVYHEKAMDEQGRSRFPSLLPDEELRKLRERNFSVFMSQYMNDPMNPEALDFKPGWLRRYRLVKTEEGPACECDGAKFYLKDMDVRLAVDPAASGDVDGLAARASARGRRQKANNAIVVWAAHGSGRFFMMDCWTGRGRGENPELEVATEIYKMVRRWEGYVRRGYVEAYGAQRALITVFNMLCKENQFAFTLEEIGRGNTKSKLVRIRSTVGPLGQNGQLYCREIHDQFIGEFGTFPQSQEFDTLDASTWCLSKLRRPPGNVETELVRRANAKRSQLRLRYAGVTGY